MRPVNDYIAAGRAACPEEKQITVNEMQQIFRDANGDMFWVIVNSFYFGLAIGHNEASN